MNENLGRRDFLKLMGGAGVGAAAGAAGVLELRRRLEPTTGLTIPDVLQAFGGEIAFEFMRTTVRQAPFSQFIEVQSPHINVSHDAGGWVITDPANPSSFGAFYFDQNGWIDTARSGCEPMANIKRHDDPIVAGILAGNSIPTAYRTHRALGAKIGSRIALYGLPGEGRFAFAQSTPDHQIEWELFMEGTEKIEYQHPHYKGMMPIQFWFKTNHNLHPQFDLIQGLAYTDRTGIWKYIRENVYTPNNQVAMCLSAYRGGKKVFSVIDEPSIHGTRQLVIPSTGMTVGYNSSSFYDTGPVVEAMAVEGLNGPTDYARLVIETARISGDMHRDGLPANLLEKFPQLKKGE